MRTFNKLMALFFSLSIFINFIGIMSIDSYGDQINNTVFINTEDDNEYNFFKTHDSNEYKFIKNSDNGELKEEDDDKSKETGDGDLDKSIGNLDEVDKKEKSNQEFNLQDGINIFNNNFEFRSNILPELLLARSFSNPITPPETVAEDQIAPSNYLQIIDSIPDANISILEHGSGVIDERKLDASSERKNDALWNADWDIASNHIFSRYEKGGALSVRFRGSDTNADNYDFSAEAGWREKDLSLKTTDMWVKVKYTNAAYYNGKLVDAVATIKVTPSKNRTPGASWAKPNYSNKDNWNDDWSRSSYYPTIQLSDILYQGWCWQNVKEINIDLQFFNKNDNNPIQFNSGKFGDNEATYYTINSLNPIRTQRNGENPPTAYGPEYVLPDSNTINKAYVIPGSHIVTSYDGGSPKTGIQYAYNGGKAPWGDNYGTNFGDEQDYPHHPDWSYNSVLFTTSNTDRMNFTMGNLERDPKVDYVAPPDHPEYTTSQDVKRTNFVWTSMSTQAFRNPTVELKNIPVEKNWKDSSGDLQSVRVMLYAQWIQNGVNHKRLIQSILLTEDKDWKGEFKNIPTESSMENKLNLAPGGYEYVIEEDVPDGYELESISQSSNGGYIISNKKEFPKEFDLPIQKKWYSATNIEINQSGLPDVEIKLYRKTSNGENELVKINGSDSIFLKRDNDGYWKYTYKKLPTQNDDGKFYTYWIEEVVPTGFIEITVDGENKLEIRKDMDLSKISSLVVKNRLTPQLPTTGGIGSVFIISLGVVISTIGLMYVKRLNSM